MTNQGKLISKVVQRSAKADGMKKTLKSNQVVEPKNPKVVSKEAAKQILLSLDEVAAWSALIHSPDQRIGLSTLIYLTDLAYGKAREAQ
jgi:hypothetical protein